MTLESDVIRVHVAHIRITAKAGVPFAIEMKGTGTTGYELKPRDLPSPLEMMGEDFVAGEGIGAMGNVTFTFMSPTEGSFILWIDSKRPWEEFANETFCYEITVIPAD